MGSGSAWCVFFSQLYGWSLHPGHSRPGASPSPSMAECALLADHMLKFYLNRFEEDS